MESRTQGSRPRPRTQKDFEAKAKDRPSRGLGQGPRTQTQVFSKKKGLQNFFQTISRERSSKNFSGEKGLQKFFFRRSLLEETKKKVFAEFPQGFWRFPTKFQRFKIVLSSSRGQGNFRGLEASRPRPRTSKCVLEAKDSSRPRTSSRTPPLQQINITKTVIGQIGMHLCDWFVLHALRCFPLPVNLSLSFVGER